MKYIKTNTTPLIVIIMLLSLRFYFFYNSPKPFKDGDKIRLTSTVRNEPVRYETSQQVNLSGLKVNLPMYPEIFYGDKVVVEGIVNRNKLVSARLIGQKSSEGLLYAFRQKLIDFYDSSLPTPHSALIAGVTIGSKSGIPQEFWTKLKNTGTAHVVVASGMNISLIAGFFIAFFTLFLKRRKALIFTLLGIWFYAVLAGFDAPIVRSAIMGSIAFSAQEFGRLNLSFRALILSAIIMLFVSPGYIQDVGFLLSFFATLGLILFESRIRGRITFVPEIIRQDLSTTLAAQIGVFVILLWAFGKFNPLSPLVNALILWTIVPMTILGILGGIVGMVVPLLGRGILLLTYPLSGWFIGVVSIFG